MDRLKKMLSMTNGKVVIGGRSNNDDKFLEPTVITDVGLDDAIMQVDIYLRFLILNKESIL